MRFRRVSFLCAFAIFPLLGLAAVAQDVPAKQVEPDVKPAVKDDVKAETKPDKPSDEPVREKKPNLNKGSSNKKQDKPSGSKPVEVDPSKDKVAAETVSKPAKAVPPVKKPLPNIGSLKHPQIPGQPWRIHDLKRPRPKAVRPGVVDTAPPSDAIILFDGENLDQWYHIGSEEEIYEAQWKVQDGYFEIEPKTGSLVSLDSFGSCQLHIEWMIPKGTTGTSQGRGNSGVKFMERYEVQVLDSFGNRTYADGQAASIYGQYPPLVNATRPQGEWQSYDIIFEAPLFEAGKLVKPPVVSVIHNGIVVQHHRELTGPTGLRGNSGEEVPPAAPIQLQDHGNRIRFRNIWVREL